MTGRRSHGRLSALNGVAHQGIYELGLIYDIDVNADGLVGIRMTLTSPACPAAQSLPGEVKAKAKTVPGVSDAWVDVVWEPTWDMSKMSDEAKLQVGLL